MVKIRVEINKTETRKTVEKNQQNQSQFFEKIEKTDKPLARLTKTIRFKFLKSTELLKKTEHQSFINLQKIKERGNF